MKRDLKTAPGRETREVSRADLESHTRELKGIKTETTTDHLKETPKETDLRNTDKTGLVILVIDQMRDSTRKGVETGKTTGATRDNQKDLKTGTKRDLTKDMMKDHKADLRADTRTCLKRGHKTESTVRIDFKKRDPNLGIRNTDKIINN